MAKYRRKAGEPVEARQMKDGSWYFPDRYGDGTYLSDDDFRKTYEPIEDDVASGVDAEPEQPITATLTLGPPTYQGKACDSTTFKVGIEGQPHKIVYAKIQTLSGSDAAVRADCRIDLPDGSEAFVVTAIGYPVEDAKDAKPGPDDEAEFIAAERAWLRDEIAASQAPEPDYTRGVVTAEGIYDA